MLLEAIHPPLFFISQRGFTRGSNTPPILIVATLLPLASGGNLSLVRISQGRPAGTQGRQRGKGKLELASARVKAVVKARQETAALAQDRQSLHALKALHNLL